MEVNVFDYVNKEINLKDNMTPLYEAISNSIYSHSTIIKIELQRCLQQNLINNPQQIQSLVIIDNGEGFNSLNYKTFNTAYESQKDKGKGKGRFSYLKAFEKASIHSNYFEDNTWLERVFDFEQTKSGIKIIKEPTISTKQEAKTILTLRNIKENYKIFNNLDKIAWSIILHFLLEFDTNTSFDIFLKDEEKECSLRRLFNENLKKQLNIATFEIEDIMFSLKYMLIPKEHNFKDSLIIATANKRSVIETKLSSYNPIFNSDFNGNIVYSYIESVYLDDNVNASRDKFNENLILGSKYKISPKVEEIFNRSTKKLIECLKNEIDDINIKKEIRLNKYFDSSINLSDKIIYNKYKNQILAEVNEGTKDKSIERLFDEKRREIRKETHNNIKKIDFENLNYKEKLNKIKEKVDITMHTALADYIIERKVIIKLYHELLRGQYDIKQMKTGEKKDYEYRLEDEIHKLLYPQNSTNFEIGYDEHNLWLIDDSLAFQSYIGSEKQMKTFIKDGSIDRPDIIFLSDYDINDVLDSITIIELKRPEFGINGREEKPDEQLLRYVKQIKNGNLKIQGKELSISSTTKFYCYILLDLNTENKEYFFDKDYQELREGKGYFQYRKNYNMFINVYDYRAMGRDAERRNKAFFKKLGIEHN